MRELKIITKKQKKILDSLFEILDITAEDLVELKNSKEEIELLKKENEITNKRLENLEKAYKVLSDNVSDLITDKQNDEIKAVYDWGVENDR